jgi:hypothetical protein
MGVGAHTKRGRPLKFGRPSTLLAVKVPQDTVAALRKLNPDLGRAIVALTVRRAQQLARPRGATPLLKLVRLHRDHFVIVVDRTRVPPLPGIAMVPVNDSEALLAFQGAGALFELELAIREALDDDALDSQRRQSLAEARQQVRSWRQDGRLRAEIRHLVVMRRARALSPGREP